MCVCQYVQFISLVSYIFTRENGSYLVTWSVRQKGKSACFQQQRVGLVDRTFGPNAGRSGPRNVIVLNQSWIVIIVFKIIWHQINSVWRQINRKKYEYNRNFA